MTYTVQQIVQPAQIAQAGVPEPLFQEIVGHERQGVAQQVYFKEGHTLAQKQEGIERFRV